MEAVAGQAQKLFADHAQPVLDQLQPILEQHVQPILTKAHHAHLVFQEFLSTEHNVIPHMPWEEQMAGATGLSLSQFRFTLALFATVSLAAVIRLIRNPTIRHLYAIIMGAAVIYYPFGSGIIHVLPMAAAAYLALLLAPRRAGAIAWVTVFPYLIYLHVTNASGESWKSGNMDFTGGAMVVMLKMIAICVCRQDSFRKNKEDMTPYQSAHALVSTPTPLEFLSYLFGLGSLIAGPFYEFSDYKMFIELKGPWGPKTANRPRGSLTRGCLAFIEGLWHMGVYLGLTLSGWSMDHYHSTWYYKQHFAIKCAAICVIGLVYQLRYYFTWKITEAAYVFAGLDFVGWDDKTGKPQWGRCRNCNFLGVWLADSARNVPLNWNICTGFWLRRYVYERVTPRNKRPGFRALLFTQLISAVWHGLYVGYILFFAGSAVWIYFSQILFKAETYMPRILTTNLLYRAIKVMWTAFVLNYMACAFQLLDYKASMEAYASVGYFPFIVMFTVNVLGSFIKPKRGPKPKAGAAGAGPLASANGPRANGVKAE